MTADVTAKPEKTASRIARATPLRPVLALVLGSGFGAVHREIQPSAELSYEMLPGFLASRVDGHSGKLIIGTLAGIPIILLCGRSHYYEGHSLAAITFPIRVLAECGVRVLVLTNAAGGINRKFRPGDFMCLTDHINFMGANPLQGCSGCADKDAFVDLSQVYDLELARLLSSAARQERIRLHAGVYAAVPGPCYETPAEIRALGRLGADAVGMSTVPEAIVARQCGLRVAGLSCITNPAAGLNSQPISHAEVLAVGNRVRTQAAALLRAFVQIGCESGVFAMATPN